MRGREIDTEQKSHVYMFPKQEKEGLLVEGKKKIKGLV